MQKWETPEDRSVSHDGARRYLHVMSGPRLIASLFYLLMLVGLALRPGDTAPVTATGVAGCLVCGPRGTADAILAAALLVPLGALLASAGRGGGLRWVVPLLVAVAVAAALQGLGLAVNGRQATAGAVVFGAVGGALGVALVGTARFWARPSTSAGTRLAMGATALAMALIALTGWLLRPELPDPPYRVEFATQRPGMALYTGTILGGGVEPFLLRPGPSGRGELARRALEAGAPVGAVVIAGPPPGAVAPLIALYDARDRTVVMVGIDSTDVVYRDFSRATGRRLDSPEIRFPGGADHAVPGDTVRVAVRRSDDGLCLLRANDWECGHGIGAAGGWRVLRAMNGASPGVHGALNGAWLALLVIPIGFWARWPAALALGAVVAWYVLIRAPLDTVLVAPPAVELLGVAAGVGLGLLARRATARGGFDRDDHEGRAGERPLEHPETAAGRSAGDPTLWITPCKAYPPHGVATPARGTGCGTGCIALGR
jgi:hypothetical protein